LKKEKKFKQTGLNLSFNRPRIWQMLLQVIFLHLVNRFIPEVHLQGTGNCLYNKQIHHT